MTAGIGIALAFVAMLCWGFGDFLIQKSTRRLGDIETMFIITAFGGLVLLPFVWRGILPLFYSNIGGVKLLLLASSVLLFAGMLEFESVRRGKLSVIEPVWSLEIVSAAFLAFFLLGERISILQMILVAALMAGLIFTALRNRHAAKSFILEKGVLIALFAGLSMGAAGFFLGWAGRATDPIMTNFFSDVFLAVCTGLYLAYQGRFSRIFKDLKSSYPMLLPMSIADKVAWLAYVFSMSLIPIAIATGLSESYIIIVVLLGLFVNKEKLHPHQKIGLVVALAAAIILASVTSA